MLVVLILHQNIRLLLLLKNALLVHDHCILRKLALVVHEIILHHVVILVDLILVLLELLYLIESW